MNSDKEKIFANFLNKYFSLGNSMMKGATSFMNDARNDKMLDAKIADSFYYIKTMNSPSQIAVLIESSTKRKFSSDEEIYYFMSVIEESCLLNLAPDIEDLNCEEGDL